MKKIVYILLFSFILLDVAAQARRSGKVKRKYRQEEAVDKTQPVVFVHGRVRNLEREPIQGATVVVRGTLIHVNTNEDGEYYIQGMGTGVNSIMVSHHGYKTKIIDYYLQEGNNDVYVTLDRDRIMLDPVTVVAQQREQQILDIPAAITSISGKMLEAAHLHEMDQVADYVPGMYARIQTPHRPTFVIRGLTSDEVSPAAQPRVAVYFNQVPVSRASMSVSEIYDMERIEVLKGPQGTLFGRGAQAGAIRFITRKPAPQLEGYLTAGMGNFGRKELQGALNVPMAGDKLLFRASGIYSYHDGYVENTFGGQLNGKNTLGGRFSLRVMPVKRVKVDIVVNYQEDDHPGTAFMSQRFPNTNGIRDIYRYQASLEKGEQLYNTRNVFSTSLDMKYFRNENNYWSTLSSYTTNQAASRWDGDGTQAPAIDMAESVDVSQLTQELRLNFSGKSRINGFVGAGYWLEQVRQSYWFAPNEQHMAYLFLRMPEYLVTPDGVAMPMPALPQDPGLGPVAGLALPEHHEEQNLSAAVNQAVDLFGDASWKWGPRLMITGGLRGTYESFRVNHESMMIAGDPSVLGMLSGNYPNLFFKPLALTEVQKSFLSWSGRVNLKYEFNTHANMYVGYARGRRPDVIQFNAAGQHEILKQEVLHSMDGGFKWTYKQRIWVDMAGFYQLYRNFQTAAWDSVSLNYLIQDAGKATSYGVEIQARAALLQNLEVFGNYNWIHARFDSLDSRGNPQEYAGNTFRLTPEHSFTIGLHARLKVHSGLELFLVPGYSWKSHFWFEDANSAGLEQSSYGMLTARAGLEFKKPALTFAITGSNILNEHYLISAGNTGTMFGVPTFVPGPPRMLGTRLTWRF
jgi:iron complex outermembrane recepter protein